MNIALFHKGLIWWGFIKRENKLKNFILLLSWFILLVNPILQSKYLLGKLNVLQTILFLFITLIFFFVWNLKDIQDADSQRIILLMNCASIILKCRLLKRTKIREFLLSDKLFHSGSAIGSEAVYG